MQTEVSKRSEQNLLPGVRLPLLIIQKKKKNKTPNGVEKHHKSKGMKEEGGRK